VLLSGSGACTGARLSERVLLGVRELGVREHSFPSKLGELQ
jgi:hypothetical protein